MNGIEQFHVKAVNKIIRKMEKNHFIHITTCEEGFEKCHEFCKEYDLRIQEHYPEDCYYWLKESNKDKERTEGTFKLLQGKFSSIYEKMGQKLKDFMTNKNADFVVEDEDKEESESVALSSFPDFDPSKFDSDSNIISQTAERRLMKLSSSNK